MAISFSLRDRLFKSRKEAIDFYTEICRIHINTPGRFYRIVSDPEYVTALDDLLYSDLELAEEVKGRKTSHYRLRPRLAFFYGVVHAILEDGHQVDFSFKDLIRRASDRARKKG